MKKLLHSEIILPTIMVFLFISLPAEVLTAQRGSGSSLRVSDLKGRLVIGLDCNKKCVINRVEAMGYAVISNEGGAFSSVSIGGNIYTTTSGIASPKIEYDGDNLIIDNIRYGQDGAGISEKWIFRPDSDFVDWTIERKYLNNMTLEDTGFPEWSFDGMDTWTGALLGTGGVAWCRFFDRTNASLGNHCGKVVFWNQENNSCLSIDPVRISGMQTAVRFSRQPDNRFTLNYSVTEDELRTRHFLSRFIIDRQDIWDSFDARGTAEVTYRLRAMDYDREFYRGDFTGFRNESVRSVLNTIARVGVIDEKLMGSNNWHLDMGFVCLHEQWLALMGLAIDDPDYFSNYRKTLDFFRDNAIGSDGNVKDRWAYRLWDSEPGTFWNGFYECQWGNLFDSNTDYVINVAELFQINGDIEWVRSHKRSCEMALGYLLERDKDSDGLVEVDAASHTEEKGSDWIDVIWASWENAFLNAKLYYALIQWAHVEEITGDEIKAEKYSAFAARCKNSFNRPVTDGGFWNPEKGWYVYWRDKDDSIHGDNLVTPVNFMAIGYGICDDSSRKKAILDKIEALMQEEKLFMWPISFFPYEQDEGYKVNYPFPNYENGDIFLAWGEAGIRAYKNYDTEIPVKYIRNVLEQYEKDGLAFQRYQRLTRKGAGDDILANNCLPVAGLYRDIYGIQPRYNRLLLEPRLTDELNGTRVKYDLRGLDYLIELSADDYSVSANSFTIRCGSDFGFNTSGNELQFFRGEDEEPSMIINRSDLSSLLLNIISWKKGDENLFRWQVKHGTISGKATCKIRGLNPRQRYSVLKDGKKYLTLISDSAGTVSMTLMIPTGQDNIYGLTADE
jgi:hypothetical protein